jgi:signal peptidase
MPFPKRFSRGEEWGVGARAGFPSSSDLLGERALSDASGMTAAHSAGLEVPVGAGKRVLRAFAATGTVLCVALALILLVPAALGYQRYVIVSGSMSGTYDQGAIVFDREVPVDDLKVGDAITYEPPPGTFSQDLVTHRIAWIGVDEEGERTFRTKGDANPAADPWTFNLEQDKQAKVEFSVPYVGFLLAALSIPAVRMLAIGLPAIVVAIMILAGIWRDAGEEARRRRAEAGAAQAGAQWSA